MKTQEKKPETVSHTLDGRMEAANQSPMADVLQAYMDRTTQCRKDGVPNLTASASTPNFTGMPDRLKSGVEQLSGLSMDHVRVHYNSDKPAQLQALAYTQGADIHVAPGQERHLPHEAWHVVQQMQGRVQATTQLKGTYINDSPSLEQEADLMGNRAMRGEKSVSSIQRKAAGVGSMNSGLLIQRVATPRAIPVGPRDENVTRFLNTDFGELTYGNNNGKFKAKYNARDKVLRITLPVYYPNRSEVPVGSLDKPTTSMNDSYRTLFADAVKKTWSKKKKLKTVANTSNHSMLILNPWKMKLNTVKVIVTVNSVNDSNDSFFTVISNVGAYTSGVAWQNPAVRSAMVELSAGGYQETKKSMGKKHEKYIMDKGHKNRTRKYNVFAHEAGHMLGLGDEYQIGNGTYGVPPQGIRLVNADGSISTHNTEGGEFNYLGNTYIFYNDRILRMKNSSGSWEECRNAIKGTSASHYDLTKDILGAKYATRKAAMDNSRIEKTLMGAGTRVRKAHYVTFLRALVNAIQEKFPLGGTYVAPNRLSDWTIED